MAGTAALIIAVLFLAGCNNALSYDAEETVSSRAVLDALPIIDGTWTYSYNYTSDGVQYAGHEEYVITSGSLTYTYLDTINNTDYGMSFAGTIVSVNYNPGNTSGVIIIRYTSPPSDGTVNYYNAVYFNNLTENIPRPDTVQLANAVNLSNYSNSEVANSTSASNAFTWTNASNYVNWNVVNLQSRY
jgi:hypothetical protein